MRHSLNLFIGNACSHLALDVLRHVMQYADTETARFIQTRGVTVKDGEALVTEAKRERAPEIFTADCRSPWNVVAGQPEHIRGVDSWRSLLSDCHSRTITIGNPGDNNRLLVSACLLASDANAVRTTTDIIQAAAELDGMFDVDILLMADDVGHCAFGLETPSDACNNALRQTAERIEAHRQQLAETELRGVSHIVAISGRNSAGISLDMTPGTLTRLLATYCTLTAEQYMSVFNLADDNDNTRHVVVPGLSVLEFDRYLLTGYLLNRAYRSVLESEGVGQQTVDINTVALPAHQLVTRHKDFLSHFWSRHVQQMIDKGHTPSEIAAQAERPMAQTVQEIETDMMSLLARQDLSLPEKRCVMAMLLGEDDQLLTGQLFNDEQQYIEDIDTEAVRLFAGDSAIDKLRWLKREIRRSTAYIRQKSDELAALGLKEDDQKKPAERHLIDGGFSWGGNTFLLTPEAEEKPLATTYTPHKTTLKSVDLRKHFTPVRNQGTQGSCSAHSGVAIMEYLLMKSGNSHPDLSEAFVYYNTRRRKGEQNIDAGATIFDMLSALQDDGVCSEQLCRYDANQVAAKPSNEAYADGIKRRVTSAQNVNTTIDDFRSALSDGMPIIISMKMYESFDAPKGFVRRPSAKDRRGGQGNHAMVVCGYSDKDRIFIVRNSWGKHFGDKGYCYMPYSFVDKDNMISMAAVITSTNMAEVKVISLDNETAVTFDQTDAGIRGALLQNLIEEERACLNELAKKYASCRAKYDAVILSQGGSNSHDKALSKNRDALTRVLTERQNQLAKLQAERDRETSMVQTRQERNSYIQLGCYLAFLLLQALLKGFDSFLFMFVEIIIFAIVFYCVWVYSENHKMHLKHRYDTKIAEAIRLVEEQKKKIDLLNVKGVIYAMALSKSQHMQARLKQQYRAICTYTDHLAKWLKDEQQRAADIHYPARDPFISCISTSTLDAFFDNCRQQIMGELRLSDYLQGTQLDEASIDNFKRELKDRIVKTLNHATADFSMLRYITGLQTYPYLPPPEDAAMLMPMLGRKGVPFLPIRDSADNCQVDYSLFIHSDSQGERNTWELSSGRHFNMRPTQNNWRQPSSLVLMQLRRIAPADIK